MIEAMDGDGDGAITLEEWLVNLKECPGLTAALAENVTDVTVDGAAVTAEEVAAVGAMLNADPQMTAAALKIQTRQRGARDRARVAEAKAAGTLPGQKRAVEAAAAGTGEAGEAAA